MKNYWFYALGIFVVVAACRKENNSTSNIDEFLIRGNKYVLNWSDEFEYNGLPDSTKWSYETGYVRNSETQYYTDKRIENCHVYDGVLHIIARNDTFEEHPVSSASIETLGKKDFLYGLIEVRAKMPHLGGGTWPAIWMVGVNRAQVGWPKCGEIDIMEWIGNAPFVALGSLYVQAAASSKYAERHWPFISIKTDFFTEEFHNYAIEWDSTQIKYFVDDANYVTFTKQDLGADWEPLLKQQYLKLNLAMGGIIPPIGGGGDIDYTKFPYTFEVEYARYYKRVE
jgi:beta-glucanase (GH16 family)